MKLPIKLLLALLLIYPSILWSQEKIKTSLSIEMIPKSPSDSAINFLYKTRVSQTIKFENYNHTQVRLSLRKFSYPIPQLFFPNLKVLEDGNEKKQLDYAFDGINLSFSVPSSNCKIVLNYDYQSDFFFRMSYKIIQYLIANIYEWHSWYFVNENMSIENVSVDVPDELLFYSNLPYVKRQAVYQLDTQIQSESKSISLYFLTKKYYDISSFSYKNIDVNLYQTKGVVISPDSTQYIMANGNPELLPVRQKHVAQVIENISEFFKNNYPMEITISDMIVDDECRYGTFGNAVSPSKDRTFILIDSTMWMDNSLSHELIHAFDNNLMQTSCDSMYHYFFAESMVEYLSVYLDTKETEERDKIFNDKALAYMHSQDTIHSVIGLKENRMNAKDNKGTSYIIYFKTPFIIHSFAKKIGENRFIKIFKEFYDQARKEQKVSMSNLESIAKKNGVTDEEWNYFLKYL